MSCITEGIYPYSNANFLKQDFNNYKNLFSNNMLNKRARSSAWLEHQSYNPGPFFLCQKESAKLSQRKRALKNFDCFSFFGTTGDFLSFRKRKKGLGASELVVEGSNPSVPKPSRPVCVRVLPPVLQQEIKL